MLTTPPAAEPGHIGRTSPPTDAADADALRADYAGRSPVTERYGTDHVVRSYDADAIDLAGQVRRELVAHGFLADDAVVARDLTDLADHIDPRHTALDEYQMNDVTRAFYDVPAARRALFERLIREVLATEVGEPFYHQDNMTLRFHFPQPDAPDVRQTFHNDVMLGHPPQMINVWVPITPVDERNALLLVDLDTSLRVMHDNDFDFERVARRTVHDDDFYALLERNATPITMAPGQYLIFDPRCIHAGQRNRSRNTRISTDLRLVTTQRLHTLRRSYASGGRMVKQFRAGDFLHLDEVDPRATG